MTVIKFKLTVFQNLFKQFYKNSINSKLNENFSLPETENNSSNMTNFRTQQQDEPDSFYLNKRKFQKSKESQEFKTLQCEQPLSVSICGDLNPYLGSRRRED